MTVSLISFLCGAFAGTMLVWMGYAAKRESDRLEEGMRAELAAMSDPPDTVQP